MIEMLDPVLNDLREAALQVFAAQRWQAYTLTNVGVYTTQNDDMYYVVETQGTKSKLDWLAKELEVLGWPGVRVIAALPPLPRQRKVKMRNEQPRV